MKLESTPSGSIALANVGRIREFGIKDPTIIMKTLSGLYSDIRRIIVQEYISNARDAHREVNKNNVPVDIKLPTEINPSLRIRDYGPGLTPNRIDDVFIMFGESTKRGDNNSTGGFGIGAKCGLAYNDKTFSVTSITKENNQNIKRIYSVFLNENEVPEMVHLNDMGDGQGEVTSQPCGVEISIPINQYDFHHIKNNLIRTCQYWNVKPNVLNDDIEYPEHEVITSNDNWEIINKNTNRYHQTSIMAILDGIQYDIPREVFEFLDDDVKNITQLDVNIYFDAGEIYPAVNRENLKINDHSRQKIVDSLTNAYKTLENKIKAEIANSKTLYEANLNFKKANSKLDFDIIKKVDWNGFVVDGSSFKFNRFSHDTVYEYLSSDYADNKLKSTKKNILRYTENSYVVYNDEKDSTRPSIRRVKTILDKYPNIDIVQVIHLTKQDDIDVAKKNGLEHLGYVNITYFEKKKNQSRSNGKRVITKCYQTNNMCSRFDSCDVDIRKDEGVYFEYHRNNIIAPHISFQRLKEIENYFKIKFVGIPSRYLSQAEKNPNMKHMTTWIKEKLNELVNKLPKLNQLDKECFFIDKYSFDTNTEKILDNYEYAKEFFYNNLNKLPKNASFSKLIRLEKLTRKYFEKHKNKFQTFDIIKKLADSVNIENPITKIITENNIESKKLLEQCIYDSKNKFQLLNFIEYMMVVSMSYESSRIKKENEKRTSQIIEYIKSQMEK